VTVTQLYELVSDPIFGKVVRYKGDPAFNTTDRGMPRVATHFVSLLPPSGGGGYPAVWIRQFLRYSPDYLPNGWGGGGAAGYKQMFIRWVAPGGDRMQFEHTANDWMNRATQNYTGAVRRSAFRSVAPTWEPVTGDRRYLVGEIIARTFDPPNTRYDPPRSGNGQWYEYVMGFQKLTAKSFRVVWAWRQYSVNGSVNPQPWIVDVMDTDHGASGPDITNARSYEMGINRNRSFNTTMSWDWGPYEIVDGTKYPNPFGIPNVP
jgi:hypothetical protein